MIEAEGGEHWRSIHVLREPVFRCPRVVVMKSDKSQSDAGLFWLFDFLAEVSIKAAMRWHQNTCSDHSEICPCRTAHAAASAVLQSIEQQA
jgi:hypothetical protein